MRLPSAMLKPFAIRPVTGERTRSHLTDLLILAAGLAVFYGILVLGRSWLGPFTPAANISRSPRALPLYAAYSLLRMAIAYFASLGFALVYGYLAAYYPKAERWLIPILDIMQSIPVLSFLPGVMLAMIAVFPHSQVGVELGAILLIFTGQVWNIAFSFYTSLKSIPRELTEAAHIYRFSRWQRLTRLELPYATMGLVWNSMVSAAGGWFFLIACEMFVLGKRDFRLPGLGSYLQTAASAGDLHAILWGLGVMIAIIVAIDQLVWRPVIAWSDKFKFEQVEGDEPPHSVVLAMLRRSPALAWLQQRAIGPWGNRITLHDARRARTARRSPRGSGACWPPRPRSAAPARCGAPAGCWSASPGPSWWRCSPAPARPCCASWRRSSWARPGRSRQESRSARRRASRASPSRSPRSRPRCRPPRSSRSCCCSCCAPAAAAWAWRRSCSCCSAPSGTSCSTSSPAPSASRATSRRRRRCSTSAASTAGACSSCPGSSPTWSPAS